MKRPPSGPSSASIAPMPPGCGAGSKTSFRSSTAATRTLGFRLGRITDLSETEADLTEVSVPVAVEEAGGFAGFRESATKTNSLIDRLETLALPVLSRVSM